MKKVLYTLSLLSAFCLLTTACGNDLKPISNIDDVPEGELIVEGEDGELFTTSGKAWRVAGFNGYYCQRWIGRSGNRARHYIRCSKGRSYNAADFGAFRAHARRFGFYNCYHNFMTRLQCHRKK